MSDYAAPNLQLTVLSEPENIALVRHALAGLAEEVGASQDLVDDIKTAVSEAVTNAIVHGYPESGGPVEIAANVVGRQLEVVVRDRGAGIQPRPLTDEETSLRVGLALIGALSNQFIVRGEEGVGTELRMSFDLDRLARDEVAQKEPGFFAEPGETEAQIAIRGAEVGGAAIPKVLEMMVARADLSIERLSDAHLIGDFLSRWSSEMTVDGNPLEMSVRDGQGRVEIKIGPLEPGVAARKLADNEFPGLGNTLERITDRAEVSETDTSDGPAEFLVLELRGD